jgi:beta-lactam-binding protein with PASTA domain
VQVPDLEGTTLIDARRLVRKAGLVIEIKRGPNAQPLGTIVAQAKKPGSHVKRGTHMLVTVSMGQSTSSTRPTHSESQPIRVPMWPERTKSQPPKTSKILDWPFAPSIKTRQARRKTDWWWNRPRLQTYQVQLGATETI